MRAEGTAPAQATEQQRAGGFGGTAKRPRAGAQHSDSTGREMGLEGEAVERDSA